MKRIKFISYPLFLILLFLSFLNLRAQEQSIKVGSTTRTMIVYAPAGLPINSPLMISLHGMNQDPAYQQNQSKWEQVADTAKFLVVYPRGLNTQWDISGTSDIDFILTIIDTMQNRFGIDKNRVYLSGFSMGGMMTYYSATKIDNKIAAFAPVSGYLMGGPNTNSSRPIPLIHVHGTADDVVVYSGVQSSINAWVSRNKCNPVAQITKPYPADKPSSIASKSYWGAGDEGTEVVLITLEGKGHWWSLDVASGVHTSAEIWKFCRKFSLDPGKPSIQFVSPKANSVYTPYDTVTVSVTATDIDGTITSVKFYNADTLLFTDTIAPYGFNIPNPSLGIWKLRAIVTDNDNKTNVVSVNMNINPPKTPVLKLAVPETNSFELPLTTDTFVFIYDKNVNCSLVKARMVNVSDTINLTLKEIGFSDTLTFMRTSDSLLTDGEYSITIFNIFDDKNIPANRNDVVRYAFGKLDESAKADTIFTDGWKTENMIPVGWKVTYNSIVREQGTSYGSGPRMLKFLPGGQFNYGMYLRDEGGISRYTYGTYEQSRLNLLNGIYTIEFYYSWWTAGTAQRDRKIQFSVLDLTNNTIFEKRDIATKHGFNENRNVVVNGSQKCEYSFTIEKNQPYIMQWSTEQFGYDGAIIGGIKLISFPSVASIAFKYKNLLASAMNNANQLLLAVDSIIYDGVQKTNLTNLVIYLGTSTMTTPSEYQSALTDLNGAIQTMLSYKTIVDNSVNVSINKIQRNLEVKEIQYFTLQGYRVAFPKVGLYIVRTIFKNGSVEVRKVFFE